MANFTAAADIDQITAAGVRTFIPARLGEDIYKGSLVALRPDGLLYNATPSEGAVFAGVARNSATTAGTDNLEVSFAAGSGNRISLRARPASTSAIASDTYKSYRLISGDNNGIIDADDEGMLAYAVDGATLTLHPDIPNSILVGVCRAVDIGVELEDASHTGAGWVDAVSAIEAKALGGNWHPTTVGSKQAESLGTISNAQVHKPRLVAFNRVDQIIDANAVVKTDTTERAPSRYWELLGTGAGTAVMHTNGGSRLITGTTDDDHAVMVAHQDSEFSIFEQTNWDTSKRLRMECQFEISSAAIGDTNLQIGFRSAEDTGETAMDRSSDDDFVLLSYNSDSAGPAETTFVVVEESGNSGSPTTTASTITAAVDTRYTVTIDFDDERFVRVWLKADGDSAASLIYTGASAHASVTDMKPFAGIQLVDAGGAAKSMEIFYVACSQDA